MKTAIQDNTPLLSQTSLDLMEEQLNSQTPGFCNILEHYGADALKPRYLSFQAPSGEDVIFIPQMRYEMGEEAWDRLNLEFREVVLRLFYEGL